MTLIYNFYTVYYHNKVIMFDPYQCLSLIGMINIGLSFSMRKVKNLVSKVN